MRKYLLPPDGQFYKANLHCHSTLSDGQMTPEELKARYKSLGYQVLAITDHDIMIPHPELNDDAFLTLTGYEMEVNEESGLPWPRTRSCHMCFIALEEENKRQVCWHPEKYLFANSGKNADKILIDEETSPYIRSYSAQGVSEMMKIGRDKGFFVTYNHPTWSLESYPQYSGYQHMHAMEICNWGCVVEGYQEYNPRVYDDLLRQGKRIYCIGADDNHALGDTGGAWVMIKAEKLHYRTITRALEAGHFYASQGPEIHDLYVEDGHIHIACSPAREIVLTFGNRRALRLKAPEGESLSTACCPLEQDGLYVRVTVIDHQGRPADTNACFLDTLI